MIFAVLAQHHTGLGSRGSSLLCPACLPVQKPVWLNGEVIKSLEALAAKQQSQVGCIRALAVLAGALQRVGNSTSFIV